MRRPAGCPATLQGGNADMGRAEFQRQNSTQNSGQEILVTMAGISRAPHSNSRRASLSEAESRCATPCSNTPSVPGADVRPIFA